MSFLNAVTIEFGTCAVLSKNELRSVFSNQIKVVFVINGFSSTKEIKIILENAMVCLLSFLWPVLLLLGKHKFPARATFNARARFAKEQGRSLIQFKKFAANA
jgi:hypothetical protein